MVTFFAIFLVLLIINASMLLFSTTGPKEKKEDLSENLTEPKSSNIYPLDLNSSEYKEAI